MYFHVFYVNPNIHNETMKLHICICLHSAFVVQTVETSGLQVDLSLRAWISGAVAMAATSVNAGVVASAEPVYDLFDNSGRYAHIKDRFGYDKSMLELSALVDRFYLWKGDAKVDYINSKGQFALKRHPRNDRGDEASILKRQTLLESIGVLQDLRGGPFLIQAADANDYDNFLTVHWATLRGSGTGL